MQEEQDCLRKTFTNQIILVFRKFRDGQNVEIKRSRTSKTCRYYVLLHVQDSKYTLKTTRRQNRTPISVNV